MHNERMHEALCRLYPDAPEGAWELACGPETDWDVVIAAWGLEVAQPTQAELDAEYVALAEEETAAAQETPPVVIASDTITVADAEFLWVAAQGSAEAPPDSMAVWLIAKLEL